jgi:hypothetical protein
MEAGLIGFVTAQGRFPGNLGASRTGRKSPGRSGAYDLGDRQFFKMSLGRAAAEDHIYDAAIEGGDIVLGWVEKSTGPIRGTRTTKRFSTSERDRTRHQR